MSDDQGRSGVRRPSVTARQSRVIALTAAVEREPQFLRFGATVESSDRVRGGRKLGDGVAQATGRSLTRASSLTSRQQQVLGLIARGLTNKEIAHELRITERGAAAHVSRLLLKFDVPNRAGLVASAFTASGRDDGASWVIATRPAGGRVAGLDLDACEDSAFLITITMGSDQTLVYRNKAARRIVSGIDPKTMVGRAARERRFPDATAAHMRDLADDALRRGVTTIADGQPVRWQNDDGSWDSGVFDWVLEPLSDGDHVEGILWIGARRP
jgi:DNA-binding CsgD family transcriptional regulator